MNHYSKWIQKNNLPEAGVLDHRIGGIVQVVLKTLCPTSTEQLPKVLGFSRSVGPKRFEKRGAEVVVADDVVFNLK